MLAPSMWTASRHLLRRTMASQPQVARQRPARPVHLYLDWDGTVTKRDTLAVLAQIVAKRNARLQKQGFLQAHSNADPGTAMTGFGSAWLADFEKHQRNYYPKSEDRKTLAAEKAWLESLKTVESASVRRVEADGFFRGCTLEDVDAAAEAAVEDGSVMLRDGWDGLFTSLLGPREGITGQECSADEDRTLSVVTVNWSVAFIRRVILHYLQHLSLAQTCKIEDLEQLVGRLNIKGNEIEGLESHAHGGSSGLLSGPQSLNIRTSTDKEQALASVVSTRKDNDEMSSRPIVVYVGDSCTDLGCLLAADFGICIRDEPLTSTQTEIQRTLGRLGIRALDAQGRSISREVQSREKVLWYAKDFREILAFIGW